VEEAAEEREGRDGGESIEEEWQVSSKSVVIVVREEEEEEGEGEGGGGMKWVRSHRTTHYPPSHHHHHRPLTPPLPPPYLTPPISALNIQRVYHGYLGRKEARLIINRQKAVVMIQTNWRTTKEWRRHRFHCLVTGKRDRAVVKVGNSSMSSGGGGGGVPLFVFVVA